MRRRGVQEREREGSVTYQQLPLCLLPVHIDARLVSRPDSDEEVSPVSARTGDGGCWG